MIKFNGTEKLQEYFFKKCVSENPSYFNNPTEYNIKIDHINGVTYLNGNKYPIMFPTSLVDYVNALSKEKKIDYNFRGFISDKRSWIKDYSDKGIIASSMNGRDPSKKYNIDSEYYKIICESKFTLTPTGDCPWSYRFFEAIMCFSIPVLEDDTDDVYHKMFKCYTHSDNHVYNLDIAKENYKIFIENFTPQ